MFLEVKRKRICELMSEPNPTVELLELEISIYILIYILILHSLFHYCNW